MNCHVRLPRLLQLSLRSVVRAGTEALHGVAAIGLRFGLPDGWLARWLVVAAIGLLTTAYALLPPQALASSQTINVQGKVTNTDGTNVADGVYDFVFKLYDGAGSGATTSFTESWTSGALWSSTMSSAPASGGTSLTYSSGTNEASIKTGQTLWNTTKGEAVTVVTVNTGTNTLTISPTRQAWNTTDTVTNRIYVKDGIFQVSLNSLNQNWGTTNFSTDLYLGITFNNDGEMKPRSQFSSVPHSFRADSAGSVDGLSIAGGKSVTFNNSLTFSGTDGTSFSLPSSSDTLVGLTANQALTNKTITTSGLLTASNGFTLSGGGLSLPNNSVTDAMVSNTLTSSIFIGSGSTTSAVDLGTGEVAGTLGIANGGTNSTATPTAGGVAYGDGVKYSFTSAGAAGQCLQSGGTDAPAWGACGEEIGAEWTAHAAAVNNPWRDVVYGNGMFVAISSGGTNNRVMTSSDGITWTIRTNSLNSTWYGITYGNGLFVAVGLNAIMTSPDGVNWTAQTSPAYYYWDSVTYGDNQFVAVSDDAGSGSAIMTSPDGINWTVQANLNVRMTSIAYGNGMYVAVAVSHTSGTDTITSPDGETWTNRANNGPFNSVVYGNGKFVAVGSNRISTSPDGMTWSNPTPPEANGWYSVTYGNGRFVAVSQDGTHRVMTSPDGSSWQLHDGVAASGWASITFGNNIFVSVAYTGTNRVMTSGSPIETITPTNNIYQGGMTVNGGLISNGGLTLSNLTTDGGLLYTNGSGVIAQTGAGMSGQCLQSNGSGAPSWGTCYAIGDDSLDFTKFADAMSLDASTDIAIGSGLTLSTSGAGDVAFNHTGDTTFAGNVGIKVADPTRELAVLGDAAISGDLAVKNITPTTSGNVQRVASEYVATTSSDFNPNSHWLALGSDGFGRMAYVTQNGKSLHFVQCLDNTCLTKNDTEVATLVTTDEGMDSPVVRMGSDGYARILYIDIGDNFTNNVVGSLHFIQCLNASCSSNINTEIDDTKIYNYASMQLHTDDTARISYKEYGPGGGRNYYLQCTNATCSTHTSPVALLTTAATHGSDFVLDSNGYAQFAYGTSISGGKGMKLVRCTNADCSTKNESTILDDINVGYPTIKLGADGYPRIVLTPWMQGNPVFIRCTTADCTSANRTVISDTAYADYADMYIGSDGFARIASGDSKTTYYQCTDADCSTHNDSYLNATGEGMQIALGPDGFARIAGATGGTYGLRKINYYKLSGETLDIVVPAGASTIGSSGSTFDAVYADQAYLTNIHSSGLGTFEGGLSVTSSAGAALKIQGSQTQAQFAESNLISNGDFATSTGWVWGSGWSFDATNLEADHAAGSTAPLTYDLGVLGSGPHLVTFTIRNLSAGSVQVQLGGAGASSFGYNYDLHSTYIVPVSGSEISFIPTSNFNGTIDNVRVSPMSGSASSLIEFVNEYDVSILQLLADGSNLTLGNGSATKLAGGLGNITLGNYALGSATTAKNNITIGNSTLASTTSGSYNIGVGGMSLFDNTTGSENVAMGYSALSYNTTGSRNVALGTYASDANLTGSNGVYIGYQAGDASSTHSKSGNIFIGYQAGYNETGSNLLYIENSNSATPLIKGDFATDALTFNGSVQVTGGLALTGTTVDITTTANQDLILQPSGSGVTRIRNNSGGATVLSLESPSGTSRWSIDQNGYLYQEGRIYLTGSSSGNTQLRITAPAGVDGLNIDSRANGGSSTFTVSYGGNVTASGQLKLTSLSTSGGILFTDASGNVQQSSSGINWNSGTGVLSGISLISTSNLQASVSITTGDLVSTTATFGSGGNTISLTPGGLTFAGNARPTKTITLTPEYSGAVLSAFYGAGTDSSIDGAMTSDIEITTANEQRTFYYWTSDQTSLNYYTVAVRVKLPKDFSAWATSNALQYDILTNTTSSADNVAEVRAYRDNNSTAIFSAVSASTTANTWRTVSVDDSVLNAGTTWNAADQTAILYFRLGAKDSNFVKIGEIKLNYLAGF